MFNYPTPGDNFIDSRDVIKAIDELEDELSVLQEENEDAELDEDDAELLEQLKAFAEEGESCPDWSYGETLIHENYFETYARELAEDIGAISNEDHWPNRCIDWEQAADELKMDYTSIEFGDETYYAHA
jgi:hypothetical protein